MKKKIHVIDATFDTTNIIRKAKSKNSFVVTEFLTTKYGRVKAGLLLTKEIGKDQAKKMLEMIGDHEKGKFFFAYVPLQSLDDYETYQNLGLTIEENQIYFDTLTALVGLDEYIDEQALKYKLAA